MTETRTRNERTCLFRSQYFRGYTDMTIVRKRNGTAKPPCFFTEEETEYLTKRIQDLKDYDPWKEAQSPRHVHRQLVQESPYESPYFMFAHYFTMDIRLPNFKLDDQESIFHRTAKASLADNRTANGTSNKARVLLINGGHLVKESEQGVEQCCNKLQSVNQQYQCASMHQVYRKAQQMQGQQHELSGQQKTQQLRTKKYVGALQLFDSDMHSEGQDSPLTKLTNTIKGTYRFGMEIPDTMINDACKKSAGYKYYRAKKAKSEKAKAAEEPEEQHASLVKRKQDLLLSLADNIVEEPVAVELVKSISIEEQQHQQCLVVEDPAVQSLLDLRKGSKASRLKSLKQAKQAVGGEGSSVAHKKYYEFENILATDSDASQDFSRSDTDEKEMMILMILIWIYRDDDVARFGVFMYNKSTEPLNSTYLSPTITCSSLEYILSLLNETLANELTYFMNNPIYTDAHITSVVANPEGNPEVLLDVVPYDLGSLDAQDVELSFHKSTHDNQDPFNDREGENMKKRTKDASEPSSRSLRKDKSHVVPAQEDTHANQHQDQEDVYVQNHPNPGWFTKKSCQQMLREEQHAKKLKELIQKDELTIADLEVVFIEAEWNIGEGDVSKPRSFERHMSKSIKPHPSFYNNDFYHLVCLRTGEKYTTSLTKHYAARYHIQGIEDMILNRWSKEVHRYQIESLNGIHHWEDARQDFFKAKINNRSPGKVYLEKRIMRSNNKEYTFSYADLSRLSLNDIEDRYLLKVQDKLHHLQPEFEKDINNALTLYLKNSDTE
ncbi:nucleic acid-binding, OB-fold-like protein [Tanacetum coccineum]